MVFGTNSWGDIVVRNFANQKHAPHDKQAVAILFVRRSRRKCSKVGGSVWWWFAIFLANRMPPALKHRCAD